MNTFENHKGSCIEPTKVSIRGLFADAVLGFKSHNLRWLILLHREDYLGKGRPGPWPLYIYIYIYICNYDEVVFGVLDVCIILLT